MSAARIQPRFPMVWPVIDVCLAVVIITVATGAMQFFREESKPKDMSPVDEVLPWQEKIGRLQAQRDLLKREMQRLTEMLAESDPETGEACREQLGRELDAVRQELVRLQAAIQAARQREEEGGGQRQGLHDSLDQLQRQIQILESELDALQVELTNLAYDRQEIERLTRERNQRRRELEEARRRHREVQDAIAAELARREQPAVEIEVHPRLTPPGNRERILIVLSQSTVTPVREPYYEPVYRETEHDRVLTRRRFVKMGEPVSEALKPGSDFLRWLNTIDLSRQYVMLDVGSDSFEPFRAVRAELRKRGIPCGWEPDPRGNVDIHFVPFGTGDEVGEGIQ